MPTRAEIVAAARGWVGTPWVHQGRTKGLACDCIGLIVGIGAELGMPGAALDRTDYRRQPDGVTLEATLRRALAPVPPPWPRNLMVADVVLMRWMKLPVHVGLLADAGEPFSLIHAYSPAGKVVEHRLDPRWLGRIVAAFRSREIA